MERSQTNCPQCQSGEESRIWVVGRGISGDRSKSAQCRKGSNSPAEKEECPGGLRYPEAGGGFHKPEAGAFLSQLHAGRSAALATSGVMPDIPGPGRLT